MPYALVHGLSVHGRSVPLSAQGVNTENSFYTDGPSITSAAGFINMLSELDGMTLVKRGKIRKGVDIKGFAFFIHSYERANGKVAFNSGTANYIGVEDKLINPPVPLEIFTADITFSLVIDYVGSLPGSQADLDQLLNARTRRFNGGTVMNDMMITDLNEVELRDYFKLYKANQIIDRSDLGITSWDDLLEYLAFYENPETQKRDLKRKSGVFYAHQTGYQLLEEPCLREGALLNGDDACEHAYCEPVINLAELRHTTHLKGFSDLHLWQWKEDHAERTILLTTTKK